MTACAPILAEAARLADAGHRFVLITVIRAEGSTPREAGARMIWLAGDEIIGTVGGGEFEHQVRALARRHYDARSTGTERFVLKTDTDQCCGGTMEVFFEHHGPRHRLVLFGAGHVAQEVCRLIQPAPIEVTVVDDRSTWNTAERFPGCARLEDFDAGVILAHEAPDATMACVMTCSHDRDRDVLRALLANPPAFVGLIGSRSKWACFSRQLITSGIGEGVVERVRCPVGLGDMGKAPPLVAVSIAGQLLLEARRLAQL